MNKKEKAKAIIDILKQRYDDAACPVVYDTTIMKARNFPN